MQRNTFLKSHRGKEPASFKLSTKSKLYVHDMSEAVLTALSVCSASEKPIVVFVSFSSFTLFPLPREKLSVLPALKEKLKGKKGDRFLTERSRRRRQPPMDVPVWKGIDPSR